MLHFYFVMILHFRILTSLYLRILIFWTLLLHFSNYNSYFNVQSLPRISLLTLYLPLYSNKGPILPVKYVLFMFWLISSWDVAIHNSSHWWNLKSFPHLPLIAVNSNVKLNPNSQNSFKINFYFTNFFSKNIFVQIFLCSLFLNCLSLTKFCKFFLIWNFKILFKFFVVTDQTVTFILGFH